MATTVPWFIDDKWHVINKSISLSDAKTYRGYFPIPLISAVGKRQLRKYKDRIAKTLLEYDKLRI